MDYQSLYDLYLHELRDLHSAEKQILRALPGVLRHTSSKKLRETIDEHLKETRTHVERLEELLEGHDRSSRRAHCRGMNGLIEEAQEWLDAEAGAEVMDAGIIAALQRVEHYEIAGYGCARSYAGLLGLADDEAILSTTLEEEREADRLLSEAANGINEKANVTA